MSTEHKPTSELRESLAVAIEDVLLMDSPEGDSPRNVAANLREVLRGLEGLEEQLERVLYIAEHLFQMVPQGVWREHGAEWQGQYEGDYHAEQLRGELASYRASIPASSPSKAAGGWCERHGGYLGQRCATCALEVADSAPATHPYPQGYPDHLTADAHDWEPPSEQNQERTPE